METENDQILKEVRPQEVIFWFKTPRNDEPASGSRLRECIQNFETLEKEIQLTRIYENATFFHRVAFGMLLLLMYKMFWRSNSRMQRVYTPWRGLKFQNFCPRGKKHGEAQWHRDHLKAMDAREHGNTIRAPLQSGGKRMKSIEILGNIADTWTTSRRSTSQAPHPGTTGTGTRAPSHWYAKTMMIVKLDRSEQEETLNPLRKFSQVFDNNKDDSTTPFRRTRECGKEHSMKNFDQN